MVIPEIEQLEILLGERTAQQIVALDQEWAKEILFPVMVDIAGDVNIQVSIEIEKDPDQVDREIIGKAKKLNCNARDLYFFRGGVFVGLAHLSGDNAILITVTTPEDHSSEDDMVVIGLLASLDFDPVKAVKVDTKERIDIFALKP